jgi:hypothetical protein
MIFVATMPAAAQTAKNYLGSWEWKGPMNREKQQVAVWVEIKKKGQKIVGSIWFNQIVDGEADGTDASYVPFAGTIKGDALTIEFDSGDVRGIDDENGAYRKPRGKPDTAVLTYKNGKIEWTQTSGRLDVGLDIPKKLTLRR